MSLKSRTFSLVACCRRYTYLTYLDSTQLNVGEIATDRLLRSEAESEMRGTLSLHSLSSWTRLISLMTTNKRTKSRVY